MRLKPGQITEHTRIVYQEAYDDGFAEGVDWATPRIWDEAIEAAAELIERRYVEGVKGIARFGGGEIHGATAIRKLKKP